MFPIGNITNMKKASKPAERDREMTEKRLLETIGTMIRETGFEKIGINAVAAQAKVSKILIYRYFGSVEGLMAAYIRQHDFWINFPREIPEREQLPAFIKQTFRSQIERLRCDPVLKRLNRWELSSDNEMVVKLREQRENRGRELIENVSRLTGRPEQETAALATILSASATYLVMLAEFCPRYNGIPLDEDSGWEQISQQTDCLIDNWFSFDKA